MPYIGQGLQQGRRQLHTFTATASQTTFIASYTPGYVDVYQNGILLAPGDYTATSGTSVVLAVGAAVNDEITIIAQHLFSIADVVSASTGGTFAGDVTMTGNLTVQGTTITVDTNTAQTLAMGDADKIKLGDDGDLEIYHSGSDSFIDDTGTGSLILRSGTTYIQNAAGTKTSIATNAGAGQTLYFNNTSKFQTTDNGALVGDGLGTEVLTILANSGGESQLRFADGTTGTAAYQGRVEYEHTAGKLNLGAGGVTQVTIDSAGNMGLGTNSPTPTASNYDSASLHISQVGSSSVGAQIRFSTGATGHAAGDGTFMAQWADSHFYITNQESNSDIRFNAGGNADMVVFDGQNGNVGIGTDSPQSMLHVETSASDFVRLTSATGNNDVGIDFFKSTTRMWNIRNNGNNDYLYITPASINDSDAVLAINPNGNVGIGQINPSYKLEVSGTGDTVQYIANANPSGTQGRTLLIRDNYASSSQDSKISFSATSSPGQDVYLGKRTTSNAGYFHLTNSSGTEHMTVNMANGKVGIGTGNPAWKFTVEGSANDDWISRIYNTNTNGSGTLIRTDATSANDKIALGVYADSGYKMVVRSTGNVGIGTTTTTAGKVNVELAGVAITGDTDGATMGDTSIINLYNNNQTTNSTVMLLGTTSVGVLAQIASGIGFTRENSADWGTQLRFYTHETNTTDVDALRERMRIDSSGKVGIGTTSPSVGLEVRGDSTGDEISIKYSGTAGGHNSKYLFKDFRGQTNAGIYNNLQDDGVGSAAAHMQFYTSHGGTLSSQMAISRYGHVTTPNQPGCSVYNMGFSGSSSTWSSAGNGSVNGPIWTTNVHHNNGNHYNTSNGYFTAPTDGYYLCNLNVYGKKNTNHGDNTGYWWGYFQRNGANYTGNYIMEGYYNSGDYDQGASISAIIYLALNDTVRPYLGAYIHGISVYGPTTGFSCHLLG